MTLTVVAEAIHRTLVKGFSPKALQAPGKLMDVRTDISLLTTLRHSSNPPASMIRIFYGVFAKTLKNRDITLRVTGSLNGLTKPISNESKKTALGARLTWIRLCTLTRISSGAIYLRPREGRQRSKYRVNMGFGFGIPYIVAWERAYWIRWTRFLEWTNVETE